MALWIRHCLLIATLALTGLGPGTGLAQSGQVAFGDIQENAGLPIEVTADNLNVNQNDGTAVFTGNVMIGQGTMRLSAPEVLVVYQENQSGIEQLKATGGVTLISGDDAAEASTADYNLETGLINMRGNVLLIQGPSAVAAEVMTVNTRSGTANMSGRVKTVLQQGGE
ncbi:MAG: LptA/OstA family protein [Pseudomonadota bacterium]